MSDKCAKRTKEEIAASVRKLNAEAAKAEAEANRANNEARSLDIEALGDEYEYSLRKASNKHNNVYHFSGEVNSSSTKSAIITLSKWHRMDPNADIEIIFNSPGGSVFDGFALYDHILWLRREGHHVTTGMVGMAASMAGILMQAGDNRWAGSQSWYLIHRAAFGAIGSTFEVEDRVKLIKRIEKRIVNIFVERSNFTAEQIEESWDRKDYWLDADEALEFGLVDEIRI